MFLSPWTNLSSLCTSHSDWFIYLMETSIDIVLVNLLQLCEVRQKKNIIMAVVLTCVYLYDKI